MLCTQCQTSNSIDYNFCRECGAKLSAGDGADPQVEQLLARAFSLLDQGQAQEAREAAMAVFALDPDNASAHSVLALIYEREGKIQDAIREYEAVLARNPNSTADRLKLAALRGETTTAIARRRWTPQQITVASALAAGVLVFGTGLAVISRMNASPRKQAPAGSASASLQPASARPGAPVAAPTTGPIRPLPTPPTPLVANAAAPVPTPPAPARTPNTPVVPGAGPPRPVLRPSAPLGPMTPPGVGANGGATEAGMAPAAIGEVVPLPSVPATAPGGPAITPTPPGTPPGAPALASAIAPGPTAPAAGQSAQPHDAEKVEPKPKRELLEPETGFIKIEPIGDGRETRAVAAPKGPPPTISLDFTVSEGETAALEDARRALRKAQAAAREADQSEAARQYRHAAGLFEVLVRRGGSSAQAAREGLEECRKALAALR
jgi:hypothetical protein